MRDFIGEDDLDTFEGWLKYQAVDTGTTPADQLAMWRDLYNEAKEAAASARKVGLMKLRPVDLRYAVAIRDGTDLWLTLWVRRALKGDVYVFMPRSDGRWAPHASYHCDGRTHSKSFDKKFSARQRQPLTGSFQGTEHLGVFAGHAPTGVGAICDPKDFSGVIEVGAGILGPVHGNVAVDLVAPGCEPIDLMMSLHREVTNRKFCDAEPHVVIRVFASISK